MKYKAYSDFQWIRDIGIYTQDNASECYQCIIVPVIGICHLLTIRPEKTLGPEPYELFFDYRFVEAFSTLDLAKQHMYRVYAHMYSGLNERKIDQQEDEPHLIKESDMVGSWVYEHGGRTTELILSPNMICEVCTMKSGEKVKFVKAQWRIEDNVLIIWNENGYETSFSHIVRLEKDMLIIGFFKDFEKTGG